MQTVNEEIDDAKLVRVAENARDWKGRGKEIYDPASDHGTGWIQ